MVDITSEIIDINLDDISTINLGGSSSRGGGGGNSRPSVNFGGGIELLMNDKHKNGGDSKKTLSNDIDLGDLNDLEAELNNLRALKFENK